MRRFFVLLFILLTPQLSLAAVMLEVSVNELEAEMTQNILAGLRIYQRRDNPKISVSEMRRLHRGAPADIRSALEPLGFYAPEIESALVESEGIWRASYIVTPGEPVRVRSLSVEVTGPGAKLSLFADQASAFPLQAGMVLHHGKYEQGKRDMLQWAIRNGFIEAGFATSEVQVDRGKREADIHLVMDTGHRFLFGITSSAQQIITPELLQRFVPFKEGDPYSLRELSRLQSILYGTGFFSEVTVDPDFEKVSDFHVPVKLTLAPALRNRYIFGLGYGTDTGIRGRMEWRNSLFNMYGHRVNTSLQLSEKLNRVTGNYEIPLADPRYDSLKYSGNWIQEEWDATKTDMLSAAAALTHDGPMHHYGVSLEVRKEDYEVGVTTGISQLLIPGATWSMALTDNRVNTENGWRFSLDVRGAEQNVLSDASFLQVKGDVKAILSLTEKWRAIGRATIGSTLVDSVDLLPPSLRFYAGGDQSVRGFAYRSLGPKDSSGTVIGGRYLIEGSGELERRIDETWSVATFYDTGQAMNSFDVSLKHSVGIGGRVTLPFGQIRLDLAFPLFEDAGSFRIHLNVGADL